jgi:hypothetical protein
MVPAAINRATAVPRLTLTILARPTFISAEHCVERRRPRFSSGRGLRPLQRFVMRLFASPLHGLTHLLRTRRCSRSFHRESTGGVARRLRPPEHCKGCDADTGGAALAHYSGKRRDHATRQSRFVPFLVVGPDPHNTALELRRRRSPNGEREAAASTTPLPARPPRGAVSCIDEMDSSCDLVGI